MRTNLSFLLLCIFFSSFCHAAYAGRWHVNIENPTLPVLALKANNPVYKIEIIRNEVPDAIIEHIDFSLAGTTNLSDIKALKLFEADRNDRFSDKTQWSIVSSLSENVRFPLNRSLNSDTVVLWLSIQLNDVVALTNRIGIECTGIRASGQRLQLPDSVTSLLRVGVALRQHKQDQIDTYRIPGLATTKKGTLLAVYDGRVEYSRDLQGDIDIVMNRSEDGGKTWDKLQTVLDMGEWGNLPQKFNGVSDACILVDDTNGDIYVAGLWMHGVLDHKTGKWITDLDQNSNAWQHQWQGRGSQPGTDVKQTCQFLITKSTDDGLTWSEPTNITSATKRNEWWLYAPAPGHGITLKDGTLVFPTQGRDENGLPFSNITYSKDKGKTWHASNPAYSDVTECMAVELTDGSIMLNMRDNRNRIKTSETNGRRICVTRDLGKTWAEHSTSRSALIEPVCMASIHRHELMRNGERKSVLFFSNPDSRTERSRITVKTSFDDGETWPIENQVLLDEYVGRGYSCITSVSDGLIGIVYESSQADIVYQQIDIADLIPE